MCTYVYICALCVYMCIYVQKSEKTITFFIKIDKKSSTFTENPCAKMQKTQKSEKTIMFYMKNCKNEAFLMRNLQRECFFAPGTSGAQDFPDFRFLRYVRVFCVGPPMIGVYFLSFSFIFFKSIVVYLGSPRRRRETNVCTTILQRHVAKNPGS